MKETGERYELAWRRVTGAAPSRGTGNGEQPIAPVWHAPSTKEFEARLRRWRAATPFHRAQYALEVDEREAAFGFCERLVMVPLRLATEPDRMRVVAAELLGIGGHFFAVKLAVGGYELRPMEMDGWMEPIGSFDELKQQYGSYLRNAPDPAIPWSGKEDSNTRLSHTRLGRAIHERFRLSDFSKAVAFADPSADAPGRPLIAHFGQVQFEIIDVGARYARFFVDYAEVPFKTNEPDGQLQGEVTWSPEATSGDDKMLMDGLVLVELHATMRRPVGGGTSETERNAPLLAMMQHLRDHTGEVELDVLEPNASADDAKLSTEGPARREGFVACLYVLKDGYRQNPRVGPTLEVRVTQGESEHLLRAGAWWVDRQREQSADSSTA